MERPQKTHAAIPFLYILAKTTMKIHEKVGSLFNIIYRNT